MIVFYLEKTVNIKIMCDGRNNPICGRDIIDRQRKSGEKTLNQDDFIRLFNSSNPIIERLKEKIDGETIFVFCMDTFQTPLLNRESDLSVLYFCWNERTKSWYSTYWRISDTWNVIVATIIASS